MKYYQYNSWFVTKLKLNKPCKDCKQVFNPWQMDFDHKEGSNKKANISQMKSKGRKEIMAEVEKCDLVCSNCHRQRSWVRSHLHGE